jgi:hypothetical protein
VFKIGRPQCQTQTLAPGVEPDGMERFNVAIDRKGLKPCRGKHARMTASPRRQIERGH